MSKCYDSNHPLLSIELSHVVKMVREAAELMPTRRARCQYVKYLNNPQPMCIVGHALHALGVDMTWLAQYNDTAITELWHDDEGNFPSLTDEENRALCWLSEAQSAQDSHYTWARAVERADRVWATE